MAVGKILNLKELKIWCTELARDLKPSTVFLLHGDLGVGKTQFVQFVVEALGGEGSHSPTFSVINEYPCEQFKVTHVDLYRLESGDDLESVGFWDLFSELNQVIFIEWASRLNKDDFPMDWKCQEVRIEKLSGTSRKFRLY